MVKVGRCG